MANLSGFNAAEVSPVSFEALPNGWYKVIATESEMKQTQAGNGTYLQVKFVITEGEYKNRVLWGRFNLSNPSQNAVAIGRGQLSAFCHAVNVLNPNDSTDLHNLPLMVRVTCTKSKISDDMTNDIKDYKPKDYKPGVTAASAPTASAPVKQEEPAPWKKQ